MFGPNASDDLVRQAIAGDETALRQLLERHGPTVRERFSSQIPDRCRALLTLDDLMQETYTDAFLDVGEFANRGDHSFERWLSTIAKHNLLNAIRMLDAEKRGGKRSHVVVEASDDSFIALHDLIVGSGTTPSGRAARMEAAGLLTTAVERLPEAYRQVVSMYDLNGASIDSVSQALKRSPGAVFMLRARAHKALKRLMGSRSNYLSGGA